MSSLRYCSLKYSKSDNLGDEIQSLAAEQFLPRVDRFVDRDTELHRISEPSVVFMNGWFKHGPTHWKNDAADCWPPSVHVQAAFFGFHIAYSDALLTSESLKYYKKFSPVGCRDKGTMEMLRAAGIDAYFSRCLTLTFPRRTGMPKDGQVYLVHGRQSNLLQGIPSRLLKNSEVRSHYIHPKHMNDNNLKRRMAQALLDEYRTNARLVITDLLHCAMPCLAIGIPVIFMPSAQTLKEDAYRLDPIMDLIPVYGPDDHVDWEPQVPQISAVSAQIRAQAYQLVEKSLLQRGR
jgi:hypothetical protein